MSELNKLPEVWKVQGLRETIEAPLKATLADISAALDSLSHFERQGRLPPDGVTLMVKMAVRGLHHVQELRDRLQAKVKAAEEHRILDQERHKRNQRKHRERLPKATRKQGRPAKRSVTG